MSRAPHAALLGAVLAAALMASAGTSSAEVSVIHDGGRLVGTLEMFEVGTTPRGIWTPVRTAADPATLLNPEGDLYGDRRPSLALNPITGQPEAVWSYWDGAHYQIAWSRFDGASWSQVMTDSGPDYEFLTADARQNLDPRIWIDDAGNRRVVWWRSSSSSVDDVVVSVLPAGETQWWTPHRLSMEGVPTRRPDVRTFPMYGSFIAAEEDHGGALSAVVFDAPLLTGHTPQRGSDPWGRKIVQATGTVRPLEAEVRAVSAPGGTLPVLVWRVDTSLALSAYDAESLTWSSPVFMVNPGW